MNKIHVVEFMGLIHGPTKSKPIKPTKELYKIDEFSSFEGDINFYSGRFRESSPKNQNTF